MKLGDNSSIRREVSFYSPALYVGIGGVGTTIVSYLRKKIAARLREEVPNDWDEILDSVFQFLVIDSHSRGASRVGIPTSGYFDLGDFDGKEVVSTLMKDDPNFCKWWYPDYFSEALPRSTNRTRINGRLCFLHNLLTYNNVIAGIEKCRTKAIDISHQLTATRDKRTYFNVYIFTSLCGGTGSGMFIDLAYCIRNAFSTAFLPNIYAYVITPEAVLLQAQHQHENQLMANTSACLDELDFWQNIKRGVGYEWRIGNTAIRVSDEDNKGGGWPFDLVHIFHSNNENGFAINDIDTLLKLTADVAFYDSTLPRTAHSVGGARFNVLARYHSSPLWKGKYPVNYGSAAIVALRVPIERIIGYIGMDVLGEVIRRYIMVEHWKAGEHISGNVAEGIMAAIEENAIINRIKNKPDFPKISRSYRTRMAESAKRDLTLVYNEVRDTLDGCEKSTNLFFKGRKGERGATQEFLAYFRDTLDEWIGKLLVLPTKEKMGFTSLNVERLINHVEGKLRSTKEGTQSIADKINDLKREQTRIENQLVEIYQQALRARMFSFSQRRRDLVARFDSLFDISQERIILEELYHIYKNIGDQLSNIKVALEFITNEVLREVLNRIEAAQDSIWRSTPYNDKGGGLVIEILSEKWAKNRLRDIKSKKTEFQEYVDLIWPEVVGLCVKEVQEVWNSLKKRDDINSIRKSRGYILRQTFYEKFMCEMRTAFGPRYQNFSVWSALEEEVGMYAQSEEEMKRGIEDRLRDFVSKVLPWWPIPDADLELHKLYEHGMVSTIGIMLVNEQAYQKFCARHPGFDLAGIFVSYKGDCARVDSEDIHSIQIVYFKYGAPLHLLSTLTKYRENKKRWQKKFPKIPLYTDRRYEEWISEEAVSPTTDDVKGRRRHNLGKLMAFLEDQRYKLEERLINLLSTRGKKDDIDEIRQKLRQNEELRLGYLTELETLSKEGAVTSELTNRKKPRTVFVSSTYKDLVDHRGAVRDQIARRDMLFRGMEHFGAEPHRIAPAAKIVKEVRSADVYLGVFGARYGTIDQATGVSMTELEFKEAEACTKPMLLYVVSDDALVKVADIEPDPVGRAKLDTLKTRVLRDYVVYRFSTAEDLARQVYEDLGKL